MEQVGFYIGGKAINGVAEAYNAMGDSTQLDAS